MIKKYKKHICFAFTFFALCTTSLYSAYSDDNALETIDLNSVNFDDFINTTQKVVINSDTFNNDLNLLSNSISNFNPFAVAAAISQAVRHGSDLGISLNNFYAAPSFQILFGNSIDYNNLQAAISDITSPGLSSIEQEIQSTTNGNLNSIWDIQKIMLKLVDDGSVLYNDLTDYYKFFVEHPNMSDAELQIFKQIAIRAQNSTNKVGGDLLELYNTNEIQGILKWLFGWKTYALSQGYPNVLSTNDLNQISSIQSIADLNNVINSFSSNFFNEFGANIPISSNQSPLDIDATNWNELDAQDKALTYVAWLGSMTEEMKEDYIDILNSQIEENFNETNNQIGDATSEIVNDMMLGSSSDENDRFFNVAPWVKFIISTSKRKVTPNPIHKGNLYGGIVGSDFNVTEDLLIGCTYNNFYSRTRQETKKGYLKYITHSKALSMYGSYKFTDKILLTSDFTFSRIKVRAMSNKLEKTEMQTSFKPKSFYINVGLHYIKHIESAIIKPIIGLNYIHSTIPEHDLVTKLKKVKKYKSDTLYAKFGINLSMPYILDKDAITLTPLIKASIKQRITKSKNQLQYRFAWNENYLDAGISKGYNTNYHVGAGVNMAIKEKLECDFDYDFIGRKSYKEHQLSLKLKYLF